CVAQVTADALDPSHIQVHVAATGACNDSVHSWSTEVELGALPAGTHVVSVALTIDHDPLAGGNTSTYHTSLSFDVAAGSPPPPPWPPDLGSSIVRCVGGWYTTPSVPLASVPTTLTLWGWFPYFCGRVTNASILPNGRLALTLEPGPACTDTVRLW